MAESFNNFFGKVGCRLAQNIDQPNKTFQYFLHKTEKIASTIALIPPTVNEVFNELNSLKSKKAAGSDDLAPFFHQNGFAGNCTLYDLFYRVYV